MWFRRLTCLSPLALLLATLGCGDELAHRGDQPGLEHSGDEDDESYAPDDDDEIGASPAYFGLSGELHLVEGEIGLDSALALSLWGIDNSLLCEASPAFHAEPLSIDDPDDGVRWEFELEPVSSCPTPGWPSQFVLGLGPVDPALLPAMDSAGYSALNLYGLHLSYGGSTFIFGIAGTEAHFDGQAEPEPVPVDGVYALHSLFLLPL